MTPIISFKYNQYVENSHTKKEHFLLEKFNTETENNIKTLNTYHPGLTHIYTIIFCFKHIYILTEVNIPIYSCIYIAVYTFLLCRKPLLSSSIMILTYPSRILNFQHMYTGKIYSFALCVTDTRNYINDL